MKKLSLAICVILSSIAINLQAQSNSELSIQGVLRNSNGTAVENGPYDLHFRLWDAPTNGNMVWEEEISQVDVEGGIYSVVLGSGSTPLDAAFTEQYFLGVSVEGGTELIPRAPLTSSPYALSLIGSDNIFPNSGNVGVGASAPQHKLTVQQGTAILGLDADLDAGNTAIIKTTSDGIELDAGGTDKIYAFNNGRIAATADEQFTVEGTDTAQIILSNSNGSATLGFDSTGGDDLKLANSLGETHIEGNNITLDPLSGTATIEGNTTIDGTVEVTKEGEAIQLVGSTTTQLAFYPTEIAGGKKADIGVAANGQLLVNSSNSDIVLSPGSGKRVQTTGMLYATGNESVGVSQSNHVWLRYHSDWAVRQNSRNYNLSIYASNGIRAHEYAVASDKRIKKDFNLSDSQKDLLTLSKIEVTDYRHIDEPANGKETKKGLIAQQVESVFPEAIKKGFDFIPNVFDMPVALSLKSGSLKVRLSKNHDFEIGDKIRIGTNSGDQEVLVSNIISPYEFSIDNWQGTDNKKELFIYGKEVNDFHTIDYDRIFTLNVSATQELARKVEALEKENAQLKSNATKTNDILKSLSAKVDALEQNLQMTGQK